MNLGDSWLVFPLQVIKLPGTALVRDMPIRKKHQQIMTGLGAWKQEAVYFSTGGV